MTTTASILLRGDQADKFTFGKVRVRVDRIKRIARPTRQLLLGLGGLAFSFGGGAYTTPVSGLRTIKLLSLSLIVASSSIFGGIPIPAFPRRQPTWDLRPSCKRICASNACTVRMSAKAFSRSIRSSVFSSTQIGSFSRMDCPGFVFPLNQNGRPTGVDSRAFSGTRFRSAIDLERQRKETIRMTGWRWLPRGSM